jgi:S1-C subfamily serine protease
VGAVNLKRFFPSLQSLKLVSLGILIGLTLLAAWQLVFPPARLLTRRDIDSAIERQLKKHRNEPALAARAYQAVRRSLVLVRAVQTEGKHAASGSLGTGIVIEDTGAILTNLHVVRQARAIRVTFADGFETDASITATQPENDLAVLQAAVVPDELVPATLAGAGNLQVGDEVVAVGNPFGIPGSVSSGVVSGLGRSFINKSGQKMGNLIQFDAAVNPGNSGGPLLDRNGEVVGIVTALLNPTEQEFFIGIGFAVTMETAGSVFGIPPW